MRAWLWLLDAFAPGPRCFWCGSREIPDGSDYCSQECHDLRQATGW